MTIGQPVRPDPARQWMKVLAIVAVGAAAGVTIFLVGRAVTPDYTAGLFGTHLLDAVRLKSRLATVLLALALIQVTLALWMYGRLPRVRRAPRRVATVHRVIGAVLFLLSIPISVHCIETYGIELTPLRAAVHSIAGCFFYGAFVAKVLVAAVSVSWYASALWYFDGFTLPGQ